MRPLRVVMQAFGPYAGVQVLDFAELRGKSFFLITGPTGSGKTTVLDAMSFALYGVTSGGPENEGGRSGASMRSDHADPELLTRVEFDFALGQKLYRVVREPEQERPKLRGEGTTTHGQTARIWRLREGAQGPEEDGAPLETGWTKVSAKAEELLGFRSEQFRQVVMLPQGRFQKLLESDSKEREQILRALFDTGHYAALEAELKRKAKGLSDQARTLRDKRDEALRQAEAESVDDLSERRARQALEADEAGGHAAVAEQARDDAQARLQAGRDAEARLAELAAAEATAAAARGARRARRGHAHGAPGGRAGVHGRGRPRAGRTPRAPPPRSGVRPSSTCEARAAGGGRGGSRRLRRASTSSKAAAAEREAAADEVRRLKALVGATADLAAARGRRPRRRRPPSQAARTCAQTAARARWTRSATSPPQAEARWLEAQAGRLAGGAARRTLRAPSAAPPSTPRRRSCRRSARPRTRSRPCGPRRTWRLAARDEAGSPTRRGRERCGGCRRAPRGAACVGTAGVRRPDGPAGGHHRGRGALVARSCSPTAPRRPRANEAATAAATSRRGRRHGRRRARSRPTTRSASPARRWPAQLGDAGFDDEDGWLAACRTPGRGRAPSRAWWRSTPSEAARAAERLRLARERAEGVAPPDLESARVRGPGRRATALAARTAAVELARAAETAGRQLARLEELDREAAAVHERYEVVGRLADVANGDNARHLSFQRYVLGAFLDDVLVAASQRLHLMTRGRYRLERTERRFGGKAAAGLNLEVYDAWTGVARPVATLSGGETFLAALSLALGLAEVVQAHAGGMHLETVFVDEGFGSLDDEALDLAVTTLTGLGAGGRLVGIISHVGELRERIDARLEITAGKSGSRPRSGSPEPRRLATPSHGQTHVMYTIRRHAAFVLLLVALAAVTLFALGMTMCIDWGGASAPPRDFGQPASVLLGLL